MIPNPKENIAARIVTNAPIPWANRFGGPGEYLGLNGANLANTLTANIASGLREGPLNTRAMKPKAMTKIIQLKPVISAIKPKIATTPAVKRDATSLTGFGKEKTFESNDFWSISKYYQISQELCQILKISDKRPKIRSN